MKGMFNGRRLLIVIGVVAGVAVAGGIVSATIPDADGIIHGCVGGGGKLRVLDADAGETCRTGETPLDWTQQGSPVGNDTFFNRNFQDVPLAPFPGVTVASLSVPTGTYVMHVKFRYQGTGTPGRVGWVCLSGRRYWRPRRLSERRAHGPRRPRTGRRLHDGHSGQAAG